MFALAILIGIYSYVIFALGLLGILYKGTIFISTLIFITLVIFYFRKYKEDFPKFSIKNRKFKHLLLLFGVLVFVNLIGALSPELSFDALWYHLTLPRIFLQNHSIFFIPGGIFYYSVMPKLGEMLYLPAVAFGSETVAKLIQLSFGILTSIVIYKISKKYFDEKISFFAVLVFYSSLVVAWESTVAYIDLTRTFFEAMGLWGFLVWVESKDKKWLVESAVMIGFAISTKLISMGSLVVFTALFMYIYYLREENLRQTVTGILVYWLIAIFVVLPWLLFAFTSTGNPFYPVFSDLYKTEIGLGLLNPVNAVKDLINIFMHSADPISPLYIIFLPLIFIYFKKLNKDLKIIAIYSALALVVWYLTPRTGGGRFILPYLPACSIRCVALISQIKNISVKKYSYILIIVVFVSTIFYRGVANSRYLPVILGITPKQEFLADNLNFQFGDFYDSDEFFKNTLKKNDVVLIYGFHNLYYADFLFIHESFVKKGDRFNYIATQNSVLPERFSHWNLIYANDKTSLKVYGMGGIDWHF